MATTNVLHKWFMKDLAKEKDVFGCQNPWELNPCLLKALSQLMRWHYKYKTLKVFLMVIIQLSKFWNIKIGTIKTFFQINKYFDIIFPNIDCRYDIQTKVVELFVLKNKLFLQRFATS